MKVREIHDYLLEKANAHYPEMVSVFEKQGPLFIPRRLSESLFLFLTRKVINQQLSSQMAESIWSRLLEVAEQEQGTKEDTFTSQFNEEIHKKGLVKVQIETLNHLRQVFLDGLVDEERLHQGDYEMVRKVVSGLWGYGQWSADMTSIFYFGLPDIWSDGDMALKKGLSRMLNAGHRKKIAEVPTRFAPFRSYLALHVWRYLDPEPKPNVQPE